MYSFYSWVHVNLNGIQYYKSRAKSFGALKRKMMDVFLLYWVIGGTQLLVLGLFAFNVDEEVYMHSWQLALRMNLEGAVLQSRPVNDEQFQTS